MITGTKVECSRIQSGLQTMILQEGDERRWTVGGAPHPVQRGAFGPVICHVRLTAVLQIRLGQLTEDDANRLGFSSLDSFKSDRRRRRGRWTPNKRVWAIRFHYQGIPEEYRQQNIFELLREAQGSCPG